MSLVITQITKQIANPTAHLSSFACFNIHSLAGCWCADFCRLKLPCLLEKLLILATPWWPTCSMATYGNHVGSMECHQGSNTALLRNCASSNGTLHHVATITGWWFQPTPLKNMSSSVGMMTFPIYGKIILRKNHQPVKLRYQMGIQEWPLNGVSWSFDGVFNGEKRLIWIDHINALTWNGCFYWDSYQCNSHHSNDVEVRSF